MTEPLDRACQVRVNRLQTEYVEDVLPNQEQIRNDVAWLVSTVLRLSALLEKATREK